MADWRGDVMKAGSVLSEQQKAGYLENGFIVLESQVPMPIIESIREETAGFLEQSRSLTESDDYIDIEPGHSAASPKIRRIKLPHLHIDACTRLMRHESILAPVRELIGSDLRLHTSKLNMKSAGFGSPVEWHQDWAFYPHTNDDILAVAVMLDDMNADNGPLMMIPGSHQGKIHDHHSSGKFTGAIAADEINPGQAVTVIAPAGSISLHHVRLVHGADINRSGQDRRLLLYEISAADAFPIMGALSKLPSIEEYNGRLLCGDGTLEPRLANVPVKMPMPAPTDFGSIYELQKQSARPAFK